MRHPYGKGSKRGPEFTELPLDINPKPLHSSEPRSAKAAKSWMAPVAGVVKPALHGFADAWPVSFLHANFRLNEDPRLILTT